MTEVCLPETTSGSASELAHYVEENRNQSNNLLRKAYSLGINKDEIFSRLITLAINCVNTNWDGYGALPLKESTLKNGARFALSIPLGVEMPDIDADPEGAITFEWYRSPHKILYVSIDSEGKFYYAASEGTRSQKGSGYLKSSFPVELLELISKITED